MSLDSIKRKIKYGQLGYITPSAMNYINGLEISDQQKQKILHISKKIATKLCRRVYLKDVYIAQKEVMILNDKKM